jgi:hypothetical protein
MLFALTHIVMGQNYYGSSEFKLTTDVPDSTNVSVRAYTSDYADSARKAHTSIYSLFGTIDTTTRSVNSILFTGDSVPRHQEGVLFYDTIENTLSYYNNDSRVTVNISQENHVYCKASENITNGQAVYIIEAGGPYPRIKLASNKYDSTVNAIGLATHDINNNAFGYVTTFGITRDVHTDGLIEGRKVYIDTNGLLIQTKPPYPRKVKEIGIVLYAHATHGKILVNPVQMDLNNIPEGGILFGNGGGSAAVDVSAFNYNKDEDSLYVTDFSADTFALNVGAWDDLVISGTIANSGAQAPSLRGFRGSSLVQRYALQGSTANDDFNFEFQLPHSTVRNDIGYPHLHYAPETDPGTTDTMVLKFSYTQADIHGTFGIVSDTTILVPLGALGAWQHGLVGFGYISTGNLSQVTVCNIQRLQNNVHDTYSGWIHILSVDMHVRFNKLGSKNATSD